MTPQRPQLIVIALGILLISFSVLLYEITLTRIFSVLLSYHYVFLALSIAMLGLSLGGVFDYYWSRRAAPTHGREISLAYWAALTAVTMTASVFIIDYAAARGGIALPTVVAICPFFAAGITLAATFRQLAAQSSFLYGADLVGASLGALGVVGALNVLGGPNAILAAGLAASIGAACLLAHRFSSIPLGAVATALVASGSIFLVGVVRPIAGEVPVGRDPNKDMSRLLSNPSVRGSIVESRWSAFGRTDLVRFDDDPDSMTLFIDGAAGTPMYRWDGDLDAADGPVGMLRHHFSASLPLQLLDEHQKDSALIIGPGGGRDVLVNLLAGVKSITAVELNPQFVELVQEYSDFNGGLYSSIDSVNVVVDEGRAFLKRSQEQYDIIMLSLPVTKSSRSVEAYALSENFLFTKESMQDYLAHLTPEGTLIIVAHGLEESVKLLMTSLDALSESGTTIEQAMQQVYILGHPMMPVFGLRPQPLDRDAAERLHAALHIAGFDGQQSYVPYAEQVVLDLGLSEAVDAEWIMMNQNLIDLAQGTIAPSDLIDAVPIDIRPTSDNRPFFFKFELGLPAAVRNLLWLSGGFLLAVIAAPVVVKRNRHLSPSPAIRQGTPWVLPVVFAGLGLGFMTIEIALFQRFILYLGHPTYSLAFLLFSLLVGSGIGSLASGRISPRRFISAVGGAAATVAALSILLLVLSHNLFGRFNEPQVATFVAASLLIVLGVFMGVPFPLSIRLAERLGRGQDIPWMWAINGAASVFGSVLAIAAAIEIGYVTALGIGAASYLSIAVIVLATRRHLHVGVNEPMVGMRTVEPNPASAARSE